jgi:hypothetical protein
LKPKPTTKGHYTAHMGRKPGPCGRCRRVVSGKVRGHHEGFLVMLCRDCKRFTDQVLVIRRGGHYRRRLGGEWLD